MPHTLKHARRLMGELEPYLPDGADRVLERASYWDSAVCDLYLERCEDAVFHDPPSGLKLAQMAPRYVRTLPVDDSPDGRREQNGRLVQAYSLLGAAHRATGNYGGAERAYQQALRICNRRKVPDHVLADLYCKLATLRACQKRFKEALQLAASAFDLSDAECDQQGKAQALATRGAVYAQAGRFPEAATLLSEVLGSYKLWPRVEYSVIGNLALAVCKTEDPQSLERAQAHLRKAQQLSGPRRTVKKAKLYCIEANILMREDPKRAESRFKKALATFRRFEAVYEVALVGLELAALYRFQRRWPELEAMASEIYEQFCELREDTEALAALKLWLEAVEARTLTEELIADVKARLQAVKPRVI